jgi:hypothetical protein
MIKNVHDVGVQMYSEITSQYLDASKKSGKVDRSTFEVVTRDILLVSQRFSS